MAATIRSCCAPPSCFSAPQRMTLHEGALLAATRSASPAPSRRRCSPLVSMLGLRPRPDRRPRRRQRRSTGSAATASNGARPDRRATRTRGPRLGDRPLARASARRSTSRRAAHRAARRAAHLVCRARHRGTEIGDPLWRGEPSTRRPAAACVGLFRLNFRDPSRGATKTSPASRSI